MNMTFAQAIEAPSATQTTNGMVAYDKTGNLNTDLFFNIGAARNDQDGIKVAFARAFADDPLTAAKILFWSRDVREGAGERQTFRNLLNVLEVVSPSTVMKNIKLIPHFGRWDDLFALQTKQCREAAFSLIADTLRNQRDGYGLCAKWTPRQGKNAVQLRNWMNMSPKAYRKMLVNGTKVVETAMCSGDWSKINYEQVPSIAAKQYANAFGRHDPYGYNAYKDALKTGEAKINAAAIFPHDIVHSVRHGDADIASAQWDALPNYLGDDYILPVVDVSGSMDCPVGSSNVTCMDVAVSLGLYVATKQQGAFHNVFCTFSASPHLQVIQGDTLKAQVLELCDAEWGMNTNIEAVFQLILSRGIEHKVPQSEMPKVILIMSDMQADQCMQSPSDTMMSMIRNQYDAAGYECPSVVFWNMNGRYGNAPVKFDEAGTALISGFSPSIMKSVLKADEMTPVSVMMQTIGSDRYNVVTI
jgi:hypothetical protein